MTRLAYLIERYGGAIEADLHHHYRLDLLDLWRGALSPRKVLNLIDHLPATSNYIAAMAGDDQLANQEHASAGPRGPRLQDWSPEVAALAAVVDRLGELIRIQIARAGKKPPAIRAFPRPVTAADRARIRRRHQQHRELVARVLPDRR
jgi:hypothetical protein